MTDEERREIRRQLEIVVEGLDSRVRQVAEGVVMNAERLDRIEDRLETSISETARQFQIVGAEFKAVRADMRSFRAETAEEFKAVRGEMARGFADVRAEAVAFRAETSQNFAGIRAELAGSHSDLDRRLRTVESR